MSGVFGVLTLPLLIQLSKGEYNSSLSNIYIVNPNMCHKYRILSPIYKS